MFCHYSPKKAPVASGRILAFAGAKRGQRCLIQDFNAALAMKADQIAPAEAGNGAADARIA